MLYKTIPFFPIVIGSTFQIIGKHLYFSSAAARIGVVSRYLIEAGKEDGSSVVQN